MYSIDTSAWIDAWNKDHPPDVFPSLWKRVESGIASGLIVASKTVLTELEEQDDALLAWATQQKGLFLEDEEAVQIFVTEFYRHYPVSNVDWTKRLIGADLFVVGRARQNGFAVVTSENPSNDPLRPKIPEACKHCGVRSLRFVEMAREQKWAF